MTLVRAGRADQSDGSDLFSADGGHFRHPGGGGRLSATDGSCGVGNGNWACLVRRLVGKGIQGACAPMAELALRLQWGGGAVGDLGALGALGGAR